MKIIIDGDKYFKSAIIETDMVFTKAIFDMSLMGVTINQPENLSREMANIEGEIGDLSELQTTEKNNIVGAVNELALEHDEFARGAGLQFAVTDGILSVTY